MSLDRRLAGAAPDALFALATAAGASPLARHRWASVGHLFHRATALPSGSRTVPFDRLDGLLSACRRDDPALHSREDYVPLDPRVEVVTPVAGELLRMFPGLVERPVADARRWRLVTRACDDAVRERIGFGVSDYVTVGLRSNARAIDALARHWPDGDVTLERPAAVSAAEVAAVVALHAAPDDEVARTEAERAALDWATAPAGGLPYNPDDANSAFGRYFAARSPAAAGRLWLPPAFVPGSLVRGVIDLAREAAADPDAARRWAELTADAARTALWRFAHRIYGTPDTATGPAVTSANRVQWLAALDPKRLLAVQVVARLALDGPVVPAEPAAAEVAQQVREHPDRPVDVPLAGAMLHIDAGVDIVPLIVVAGPGYIGCRQPGGAVVMSLDDLLWISQTATAPSDLWAFCRDLTAPGASRVLAWETIDIFEAWRDNGKSLSRGGRVFDLVLCEPHAGSAEWSRAASLARAERALAATGLPPLGEWAHVERAESGPPAVYGYAARARSGDAPLPRPGDPPGGTAGTPPPRVHGWQLHPGAPAVAIVCADPAWPDGDDGLFHTLAGSYAYGLAGVADTWTAAHQGTTVAGYRVRLTAAAGAGDAIRVAAAAPSGAVVDATLAVDCTPLADLAHRDPDAAKALLAESIAGLVSAGGGDADAVRDAWADAPPTLTIRIMTLPTARADLSAPWPLDEAMAAQIAREIARAVHDAGVAPGVYAGDAANALDRDVLAPAALAALTSRLAAHDADDLVRTGMTQLDRALATGNHTVRDLEQSAQTMPVDYDPIERIAAIRQETLTLRRCQEIAVEAALRTQPTGAAPVTQLAWMEILAAAHAYLLATSRSETVYHQVRPAAIEITGMHEVEVRDDDRPPRPPGAGGYALDPAALQNARQQERLADPGTLPAGATALHPVAAESPADDDHDDGEHVRGPAIAPALDAAMLAAYGATATDLASTLLALAQWPLAADDDDTVPVHRDAVLDYLADATTWAGDAAGPARDAAAVTMLTSTAAGLAAADWRPWHARSRQKRLLAQPIPQLRDGRLVIAPHTCFGSASVYLAQIAQGQLPWTQPPPPAGVADALAGVRDRRNRALEREVEQQLRDAGHAVVARVRETDPQRLGVPELQTEIDIVAGRPGSLHLWLLEVKDPAGVYVVPEIRRQLDRFYIGGRREPAYAAQLQRKLDDLAPHADAVAAALGLPPAAVGEAYEISAAFVTRHLTPAAYVGGPFPFTTQRRLLDDLADDTLLRDAR